MAPKKPEAWLRGPRPGIPAMLQPIAFALIASLEEIDLQMSDVPDDLVWTAPAGVASPGFHILHLCGSTDRLLTYARGEVLSEAQRAHLKVESSGGNGAAGKVLVAAWRTAVERAMDQLKATPDATLAESRFVGRLKLPSTVIGLLSHAAEHAARHTGQLTTTVKILKGS